MKGTLAGKALQALTTPSISLPAYGTIIDQQTGVKHKFDPTKITHDLQNTLVAYASNPPKDELGQSAWLALLGYRQGGKSLTAELVGYPKAAYIPGFDHVCIADRKDRADYLHRRLHINHKNWPEEIRSPTRASNEVRQLTFDPAVGGIMRTLSGEQGAVGIGQSPDLFHGSEIPYWSDAEGQYSLIYPSMINRDHALMILESTPAPMDEPSSEWWKDHCRDAKNGAGRWIYAFFPFWDGKLNRRPWPKNSPMDTEEIRLMERYGHLGLTKENLAFRRLMLESDTQLRRNPDLFPCYYPFDDVTCWPMSGRSVIHKSVVERHLNHARVPWEGTNDWHYQEYEPYDPAAIYVVCVDPIGWGARDHGSFHVLKLYVGEWTQVACGSGVTDPVMLVDEVHKVSKKYGRAPIASERNGPGEGFIAALIKVGANVYWEDRNKPGVWKSSDDQMLAFLIDALKDELVLHDMDTVSQIASYKNDKKIQQSVKAEMMSSGRKSKRRGRHHWDKVSALAVGCAAARNMPRRHKRGAPPEEPDNVVLFKDMTWAQVEEYRKTVYKNPSGPVRRKSRYRSTRRRRK